jgi:hypothetical protein
MVLCNRCQTRIEGTDNPRPNEDTHHRGLLVSPRLTISREPLWSLSEFLDLVCELCRGMCQIVDSPLFMESVAHCIKTGGHETVQQVAFSFSIFPSFYIWERYQCLKYQKNHAIWKEMRDIKEIIKLSWKKAFEKQFGWSYLNQVGSSISRIYHLA